MTQAFIIDFAMESIKTTLLLSAPMLGFGLVYRACRFYFSGSNIDSGNHPNFYS
ncbi:MAG: hypothetical protein CM1200mP16_10740 [Nitrospina sp.]|nr:MAG: hypothetical protein CM1200mP16_10740 [Nitrospina sp.]